MPYNKLTPQEEDIILGKGTETPFTGEYDDFYEGVMPFFLLQKANLMLVVDGQLLTPNIQIL